MSAMINVLPAEVPPVDVKGLLFTASLDSQFISPNLNAMSGFDGLIEGLSPQAPAKLGLSDATIAKENHFYFVLGFGFEVQLRNVRT